MGLTAWYPVEALCEPGVEVQSHGRMREASKRPFVERYGIGSALIRERWMQKCGPKKPCSLQDNLSYLFYYLFFG